MFTKLWTWLKSLFSKGKADVAKVEDVVTTAVATAEDAVDGVVSEIKKLLDLYGHDIPIWDEVVALAKKV